LVTVSIIPGSISWSVFAQGGKGSDGGACVDQMVRHSAKALRRHSIAAAGGRLDQFTGSRPVLELGIHGSDVPDADLPGVEANGPRRNRRSQRRLADAAKDDFIDGKAVGSAWPLYV
jgi:hypothetical protein